MVSLQKVKLAEVKGEVQSENQWLVSTLLCHCLDSQAPCQSELDNSRIAEETLTLHTDQRLGGRVSSPLGPWIFF